MTETETKTIDAVDLIADVPPFAERLHSDAIPIQIRALTFMEVKYMRAKLKGMDEDDAAELAAAWLLRFGLLGAGSLGLNLRRETFELTTAKTDALTELSLNEFMEQPNGIVQGALEAIKAATFPSDRELERLDFTMPSAGLSVVAMKPNGSASTAITNGKLP